MASGAILRNTEEGVLDTAGPLILPAKLHSTYGASSTKHSSLQIRSIRHWHLAMIVSLHIYTLHTPYASQGSGRHGRLTDVQETGSTPLWLIDLSGMEHTGTSTPPVRVRRRSRFKDALRVARVCHLAT